MALSELQCRRLDEKLAARPGGMSLQYLVHLQSSSGAADLAELIDAITVQKTELFRDESQLAVLRSCVLEPMVARLHRPLRLWSAGCATGEEVATLLVLLAEVGAAPSSTVLGTDISETAIARARELCFTSEQLQRVQPGVRDRWFVPVGGGRFTLVGHLKDRASFLCHNLMDLPYPAAAEGQGFDVILCRNVLIYFTPESFERVVDSLAGRLAPEGLLVLSSAEPLLRAPPCLRTVRFDQAFFYARAQPSTPSTEAVPPGNVRTPSSSGLPAVGARSSPGSGRFPAVGSTKPSGSTPSGSFPAVPAKTETPTAVPGGDATPHEADALFAQVLEWAAGDDASPQTAEKLRRCLEMDPDLAAARYLLGMLLEQWGSLAEAAAEYRRALRSLEEGRARATPFFLNNARLQVACARAIERVERASGSTPPR
ncbi:methyltransferase domain-containing protein [Archangium violaceum]|nr:protein-glutamate O-methyltransferase CheR [Archangium violaceum]QRK14182.1 methyltransferase domain-containing protein [Archangium violaceum]